jgi:predicted HicB family RNase H-like nuclease
MEPASHSNQRLIQLDLNEELFEALRLQAAAEQVSIEDLVVKLLQCHLGLAVSSREPLVS